MRHGMWFGIRGREMWIPTPKIEPDYARMGWSIASQHLTGGGTVRSSKATHGAWTWEWNNAPWDEIMPILDFATGVYDTKPGVNLLYFIEPSARERNLMPPGWANPALASEDEMPLFVGNRPTAALMGVSDLRLPARKAVYDLSKGSTPVSLYIPIPPGHRAHFGWVGESGGFAVRRVTAGDTVLDSVNPPGLSGNDGIWTNSSFGREGGACGIEISPRTNAALSVTTTTCLMLPEGAVPRVGVPWRSGMGHTGAQFRNAPTLVPLSVPLDRVSTTATLEETGAYL